MNTIDSQLGEFVIVSILAGSFLVFDLATAAIQSRALPAVGFFAAAMEGFCIGTLFAQVVILALWARLSNGATMTRTCYAFLLLVAGGVLLNGFVVRFAPEIIRLRVYWAADDFGWLMLVVVFSAVQLPVLFLRRWSGYSIGRAFASEDRAGQFSLADLLMKPLLLCVPLAAMTAILETLQPWFLLTILMVLVVICLLYGAFHIWILLRPQPSMTALAILLLLGPIFLVPASLFFTGKITGGRLYGMPFSAILVCVHCGALAMGLPTAVVARLLGYRLSAGGPPISLSVRAS